MKLYNEEEFEIISENMKRYGGSFFKKIGQAIDCADMPNKRKLARTFAKEFSKYLDFKR